MMPTAESSPSCIAVSVRPWLARWAKYTEPTTATIPAARADPLARLQHAPGPRPPGARGPG